MKTISDGWVVFWRKNDGPIDMSYVYVRRPCPAGEAMRDAEQTLCDDLPRGEVSTFEMFGAVALEY